MIGREDSACSVLHGMLTPTIPIHMLQNEERMLALEFTPDVLFYDLHICLRCSAPHDKYLGVPLMCYCHTSYPLHTGQVLMNAMWYASP